jgi:hypothetical protein
MVAGRRIVTHRSILVRATNTRVRRPTHLVVAYRTPGGMAPCMAKVPELL